MTKGLNFALREYSDAAIDEAEHPYELKEDGRLYLHIDAAHHGIGGDDSWRRRVHPEFILTDKTNYTMEFMLQIE